MHFFKIRRRPNAAVFSLLAKMFKYWLSKTFSEIRAFTLFALMQRARMLTREQCSPEEWEWGGFIDLPEARVGVELGEVSVFC